MKAVEYYNKYHEAIMDPVENPQIYSTKDSIDRQNKAIVDMLRELMTELIELRKSRNAVTNKAILAVIKEINDKWNRIIRMMKKECGEYILKPNAINREIVKSHPIFSEFLDCSEEWK